MRLISWPTCIGVTAVTMLTGPNVRSSGTNAALSGREQTFSSIGDLVSFSYDLGPKNGARARQERGLLLAGQNGVNAFRVQFVDPDRRHDYYTEAVWEDGFSWDDGASWGGGQPHVAPSSGSPKGSTIISLQDVFWGHDLDLGDCIGFLPNHFGAYFVTEVIDDGVYRVWPSLRKAIYATTTFATLTPVLAMKMRPNGYALRRAAMTEGQFIDFVEVPNYYVDEFFS
ncbi:hypothetical protein [Acuticoccus sediminis]|uniref:hypothetical protein n=1 Tax=Acuticoccus sediminis TaxID=2184697 RepID=UPI001CFC9869|nr:hypothetical protein [Acuticoccus sediminis]